MIIIIEYKKADNSNAIKKLNDVESYGEVNEYLQIKGCGYTYCIKYDHIISYEIKENKEKDELLKS